MSLLPDPTWPAIGLAIILFADGLLTFRPPRFIAACLNGVGFPREWWWVLALVKFLAASGLMAGVWVPGIGLAATAGILVYFLVAAAAHLRARYVGVDFWLNCLGMVAITLLVLVFSFL